jgi:L-amino acid N-acyltransferase YncA
MLDILKTRTNWKLVETEYTGITNAVETWNRAPRSRWVIEPVTIREVGSHQVHIWRDLQLQAVKDSPANFRHSLTKLEQRSNTEWSQEVLGPGFTGLVAWEGDEPIGCIYLKKSSRVPNLGYVGGSWVVPEWRTKDIGFALGSYVINLSRAGGFTKLLAWIAADNSNTLNLAARHGYYRTGVTAPWPTDPDRVAVQIAMDIPQEPPAQ